LCNNRLDNSSKMNLMLQYIDVNQLDRMRM